MSSHHRAVNVRYAEPDDVTALCTILNTVIAIGGTTAFEIQMTPAEFYGHFIGGPNCLVCLVAEAMTKKAQGFQVLTKHAALPHDWADIGTFARPEVVRSGIGTALFAVIRQAALDLGLIALNATIRADNPSGIPYYDRMGFETYHTDKGVPLRDGTRVDRISKRYAIQQR